MATEEVENQEKVTTEDNGLSDVKFTVEGSSEEPKEAEIVTNEPKVEETPEEVIELKADEVVDDKELVFEKEIDEAKAWEVIKAKRGLEVDSLDDLLVKPKAYSPEMEKFNEFIEKTGNTNYNDYLETQKDWETVSEDERLKAYIKLSNPSLNEQEANRLYEKKYGYGTLDPEYEEDKDAITDINIERKTDLNKAMAFFDKRKEEFKAIGGSDAHIPEQYREAKKILDSQIQEQEKNKTLQEKLRNDFVSKTDSYLGNNFEGFEVKLGNSEIGFENISIKPDNIQEIKEKQLNFVENVNRKFFDENGALKDPSGFSKFLYFGENYEAELNKAHARGMAKQLELDDKLSKNIQVDNLKEVSKGTTSTISYTLEK